MNSGHMEMLMNLLDGPILLGIAAVVASLAKVIEALRRPKCERSTSGSGISAEDLNTGAEMVVDNTKKIRQCSRAAKAPRNRS